MATFHCEATGNPTPEITWTKNGKTVGEGNKLSFEANKNQSGEYWCSAENGLETKINTSASLDVQCKCQSIIQITVFGVTSYLIRWVII